MARSRPRSRFRLFLEQLEDRTVPSGLVPMPVDGGSGLFGPGAAERRVNGFALIEPR